MTFGSEIGKQFVVGVDGTQTGRKHAHFAGVYFRLLFYDCGSSASASNKPNACPDIIRLGEVENRQKCLRERPSPPASILDNVDDAHS